MLILIFSRAIRLNDLLGPKAPGSTTKYNVYKVTSAQSKAACTYGEIWWYGATGLAVSVKESPPVGGDSYVLDFLGDGIFERGG